MKICIEENAFDNVIYKVAADRFLPVLAHHDMFIGYNLKLGYPINKLNVTDLRIIIKHLLWL